MLQVKSFKISDDKGINELLNKSRLANGAHILITDGYVCVPYEDGLEPNKEQRLITLREERNNFLKQKELLDHSNEVMAIMRDNNIKRAKKFEEFDNIINQNQAELDRLVINLEVFTKRINELENAS